MRKRKLFSIATLAALALGSTINANASDVSLVAVDVAYEQDLITESDEDRTETVNTAVLLEDRFANMEARLSMIESQTVVAAPAPSACNSCPTPSSRIATNCVGKCTTYAGVELAILKPHTGALSITALGTTTNLTPAFDSDVSPRIFIGRELSNGLGFRATYWQYDHKTDDTAIGGLFTGLEIHALDLETTSRTQFYGSDVTVSAGLRYGNMELGLTVPGLGSAAYETEGVGPTFAAQMRRQLGSSNLHYFLGGRASILLTDSSLVIPGLVSLDADDTVTQVLELRSGLEARRRLGSNELVAQVAFETQNWQAGAIAGLVNPDVALVGPAFRLGLTF
ncbi:hypothetical protein [Stieleria varia]|uniref:Outer membrane protein beta-barrel domain-containing protein n=1 Tax=Stieleria varia TaxID=2528005 RepID=A0A5C6A3I4_9BACT|nr:hypothetical protein [Stieleria varia]TWT93761.1 hypothetical protein Pla52n_55890 [Stieleria varia]